MTNTPKQLTTSLTPLNPTTEQARVFHLILIALDAARHIDAAPLALETECFEGVAVTVCGGALVLYETTTKARSIRSTGEGEEVPAWGISRLLHFRGDREEPPSDEYEEIHVRRGLGEAVSELVIEVVRECVNGALDNEAERQMMKDEAEAWPERDDFDGLTSEGEINYALSDHLADAARERKFF